MAWRNLVKKAAKKSSGFFTRGGDEDESLSSGAAALVGTGLAELGLFGGLALHRKSMGKLSLEKARKFDKDLIELAKSRGSEAAKDFKRGPVGTSFYAWNVDKKGKKLNEIIRVDTLEPGGVTAHELTHSLKPKGKLMQALRKISQNPSYQLAAGASPLLGIAAGASGNDKLDTYGPLAAALLTLPQMAEEGRANLGGYKMLKQVGASKGALRNNLKRLLNAYSTYATRPALALAGGYGAKYIRKKLIEANKKGKK